MASYRGYKAVVPDDITCKYGFYIPNPPDMYDGDHTFLYYYTQFRYGGVMQLTQPAPPSGGAANRINAAGTFVKAP